MGVLPSGTLFLRTYISSGNYLQEWWASADSSPDCVDAESITLAVGETQSGKDFHLDEGAVIEGAVFEEDGTTPISIHDNLRLRAIRGDPCGEYSTAGIPARWSTGENGEYSNQGLSSGTYYLRSDSSSYVFSEIPMIVPWPALS